MRIMASVMLVALGAMLSASLRAPAQEVAESEAVARDRARYAGTWRLVAVETNGEAREEADRAILVVNRADGSWTMTVDGTEMNGGESRIDPLATPPEIDIEITSGDGKGEVLKGIYEVGEKRRRICFRGQQGWRPKEFRTQQDDGAVLATFEKQ